MALSHGFPGFVAIKTVAKWAMFSGPQALFQKSSAAESRSVRGSPMARLAK